MLLQMQEKNNSIELQNRILKLFKDDLTYKIYLCSRCFMSMLLNHWSGLFLENIYNMLFFVSETSNTSGKSLHLQMADDSIVIKTHIIIVFCHSIICVSLNFIY